MEIHYSSWKASNIEESLTLLLKSDSVYNVLSREVFNIRVKMNGQNEIYSATGEWH